MHKMSIYDRGGEAFGSTVYSRPGGQREKQLRHENSGRYTAEAAAKKNYSYGAGTGNLYLSI